jgi:hypothetical protein
MTSDEKVINRLQEMIDRGREIERTKRNPPPDCIGFDATVDDQAGSQWLASSINILSRAFGKDSEHYLLFQGCFAKGLTYSPLHRGIGVLEAAKEDLEHGYLRDLRILVAAEVFSDFLEQASMLLEAGYIGPASVVAGTVLEDNLRKLCSVNSIELPERPKLDYMNAQLAKAEVYNKLTQKRLTAIADIRNSAAHGKWEEFTTEDVADMIKWIIAFTEKQLG